MDVPTSAAMDANWKRHLEPFEPALAACSTSRISRHDNANFTWTCAHCGQRCGTQPGEGLTQAYSGSERQHVARPGDIVRQVN